MRSATAPTTLRSRPRRVLISGLVVTAALAVPATTASALASDDPVLEQAYQVDAGPVDVPPADADVMLTAPTWAWPEAPSTTTTQSLRENCGLPFRIGPPIPGWGHWYQICVTDSFRYYIRRLDWTL